MEKVYTINLFLRALERHAMSHHCVTRQLCVYKRVRPRGNMQKSIHAKTSEKRAYRKNTYPRKENTHTHLRLGSQGKNFAGVSN